MVAMIQIMTTTPDKQEADRIAEELVTRRLAGCVQVAGPITSTYRWQGKIETSEEWLCIIKTRRANYAAVEQAILELHSYEVPEILAINVVEGSQSYLDWLAHQLRPSLDPEDHDRFL
jgi:periplasmic divalent cation tolerance protein